MENFYDFIKENPSVKRLKINDVLFAEYRCPLSEFRFDIWSQQNYFIYVTSGKKKWFTGKGYNLINRQILGGFKKYSRLKGYRDYG